MNTALVTLISLVASRDKDYINNDKNKPKNENIDENENKNKNKSINYNIDESPAIMK
jgi:hypothetical protein